MEGDSKKRSIAMVMKDGGQTISPKRKSLKALHPFHHTEKTIPTQPSLHLFLLHPLDLVVSMPNPLRNTWQILPLLPPQPSLSHGNTETPTRLPPIGLTSMGSSLFLIHGGSYPQPLLLYKLDLSEGPPLLCTWTMLQLHICMALLASLSLQTRSTSRSSPLQIPHPVFVYFVSSDTWHLLPFLPTPSSPFLRLFPHRKTVLVVSEKGSVWGDGEGDGDDDDDDDDDDDGCYEAFTLEEEEDDEVRWREACLPRDPGASSFYAATGSMLYSFSEGILQIYDTSMLPNACWREFVEDGLRGDMAVETLVATQHHRHRRGYTVFAVLRDTEGEVELWMMHHPPPPTQAIAFPRGFLHLQPVPLPPHPLPSPSGNNAISNFLMCCSTFSFSSAG